MAKRKLSDYSVEELEEEIERREAEKGKPIPLPSPDFSPLIDQAKEAIQEIVDCGHTSDDLDHYMFEIAMECIFGQNIWDWWNSHN